MYVFHLSETCNHVSSTHIKLFLTLYHFALLHLCDFLYRQQHLTFKQTAALYIKLELSERWISIAEALATVRTLRQPLPL